MRTSRLFSSLRWRIVILYLVIAIIILALTTFTIFSMVENYIVNERIGQEISEVNKLAVRVASYQESSDAASLYSILYDAASQSGGRYLMTGKSGIVVADSFSLSNGVRPDISEINSVLYENRSSDYGFHNIANDAGDNWCVYYTAGVRSGSELTGVLLYSSSIQDIVDTLDGIRMNVIWIFALGLSLTVVTSLILTHIIIKPLKNLTATASKISAGDLSQRAEIKGGGEIADFGSTFNMMCDKLQYIDEQRSEFVSNASHELKTPLASMKILVESLLYQEGVDEKYYREFLSDINSELDRMTNLVNDLLLLSRMDSDSVRLNIERNSLSEIIEGCLRSLKPLADSRNTEITRSGLPDIYAECDRLKISQCVFNIINNAVKYTPDGGKINIDISERGTNAYIAVSDNGVGIAPDQLPHIFDRFFRVDKARSRETGGSGLGLHIVQKIALLHGGRVIVDSEEGKGSVFTLVLPEVSGTEKKEEKTDE